jgi:hypothetical protein
MPHQSDRAALHTDVRTALDALSGRLRSLPQSRLRAGAAAEGLDLARFLAEAAQRLEFPGREPYRIPDDGVFAVGDQLAVAGHDLLRAAADAGPVREAEVLGEALERVRRAARAAG